MLSIIIFSTDESFGLDNFLRLRLVLAVLSEECLNLTPRDILLSFSIVYFLSLYVFWTDLRFDSGLSSRSWKNSSLHCIAISSGISPLR